MITRDFDLWITQGHTKRLVFNANQYDQGETWRFRILGADGNPIVPTTAAIIGQKKDGHAILVEGTVSDGKVVITETEQMTACAGLTEFELLLNGETHGTANFTVQVEKRPGDDADFSDSDLSLIQDAVDAAETIVEVIGDSDPSEVIGEHVDAWLDNHPEATTTVLDGAITAPKINNSLWDKILVNEEASGAVASFEDGADDVPVSSLKVALEPVQLGSGDPSPSNIRPIYSANGINRLSVDSVSCGGDNTRTKTLNIETISAGTYTFSAKIDATIANNAGIQFLDANSANVGSVGITPNMTSVQASVTLTGDAVKAYFYIGTTDHNNGKYLNITNMQMGVVNAPYQPYQGIRIEQNGKNLLQNTATSKTENGITFTVNADGTVTANGTSTALVNLTVGRVYVTVGETYILKATSGGSASTYKMRAVVRNANGGAIDIGGTPFQDAYNGVDKSITMPSGASYMDVYCNVENGKTVTNALYEPMVRLASVTDATYAPYTSTSYPYTLGQSVYGGTVDLATGVLTVTHVYYQNTFTTPTNKDTQNRWVMGHYLSNASSALFGKMWDATIYATDYGFVSDSLQIHLENAEVANASTCAFYGHNSGVEYRVRVPDTYTAAEAKAIADANHIVYPIEPQTIQLTPTEVKTLLGYNNISSSGTVDVIYHADTKLYVDKMTNVDNAIIAPTEEGFTATRNYTTNDLVIVNDTLYKVTANIASGSAITPNSNVTQTTLGALIKALS